MKSANPFLIVGQGLAGTILAHHFLEAGIPFIIWDSPITHFNSSQAAGGIFNPVTGRKLEQTWLADELFPYLFDFYPRLEKTLATRFFFPMPLFRPFANEEMKNWLEERKDQIHHDYLRWEEEGVWVEQAGWVDVAALLQASRNYFVSKDLLVESEYIGNQAIFCEGFHGQQNPLWSCLPFLPAKGELMEISSMEPSEDYILNKNGFILPLGSRHFKVGATYGWKEFTNETTPEALEELSKKLSLMGCSSFELIQQKTGIRPATQDRRPFVGFHSQVKAGIFNGFGSKGVSLTPYFAKQWTDEILVKSTVHPDASIRRFYHLFSV
ncbi:FAD-dependent oxidoreductase [Aquirufa sp. HETE-83D]|uniref:FAD-dependent oxidoreductase n=1 Tax=Aquirufa esocilacus TaxID=3096513 RepID=A0ABW6DF46_9BACT